MTIYYEPGAKRYMMTIDVDQEFANCETEAQVAFRLDELINECATRNRAAFYATARSEAAVIEAWKTLRKEKK